jgi:peptidase E
MTQRHILATSGGFIATDRYGVMKPAANMLKALALSGKERPRVLFIHTASGDDRAYLTSSYQAMSSYSCDVEHLALFTQPTGPVEEVVGRADVVWVGGGSVANLLALWSLHGVDMALREAYERGAVLGGVSAGSICWHIGGPTDSFGPKLEVVTNGLALLPYGNGVHYDSEEQRRPLLHTIVGEGTLPLSYATDDRVGILYRNEEPIEVICDKEADPSTGPAAYRVEKVGSDVVETRLNVGVIAQ